MKTFDLFEAVDINDLSEYEQIAYVRNRLGNIAEINNPSERVQLAAVRQHGTNLWYIIQNGINPSERVQLAAVKDNPMVYIRLIDLHHNWSKQCKYVILTHPKLIMKPMGYEHAVKNLFPDSSILVDKWIKYGERVRVSVEKGKI